MPDAAGARIMPKLRVLFLCTGNSCRSQMAEGWARQLKGGVIDAYSAGTHPKALDPLAVRVMADVGIDISTQQPKSLDVLPPLPFDYVITVPAGPGSSTGALTTRPGSPPGPRARKRPLVITRGCATKSKPLSSSCRRRCSLTKETSDESHARE